MQIEKTKPSGNDILPHTRPSLFRRFLFKAGILTIAGAVVSAQALPSGMADSPGSKTAKVVPAASSDTSGSISYPRQFLYSEGPMLTRPQDAIKISGVQAFDVKLNDSVLVVSFLQGSIPIPLSSYIKDKGFSLDISQICYANVSMGLGVRPAAFIVFKTGIFGVIPDFANGKAYLSFVKSDDGSAIIGDPFISAKGEIFASTRTLIMWMDQAGCFISRAANLKVVAPAGANFWQRKGDSENVHFEFGGTKGIINTITNTPKISE